MKTRKKVLALACVAVLLVTVATIGVTLAYLQTKTDPVVNTFTWGDINITLEETTGAEYKMIPGNTITKDPTITVEADSEPCWLFVKIDESTNAKFSDFMTYELAEGWTKLEEQAGVYYRKLGATAADTEYRVLKDNAVVVKDTVNKEQFNELIKDGDNKNLPTLTFTAYAVQADNIDSASNAWSVAIQ